VFIPEAPKGAAIAAFAVPHGDQPSDIDLRAFIADRLPPHYQPDRLEWVEGLPRTANGKCDRARLLAAARIEAGV
jgi:pyochelin synthetase